MSLVHRRLALLATCVTLSVLASTASVAFANHTFPDVSTGSPFHDEIANIVGAGVATGFPNNTYRPTDAVNRQQMAAFINRSGGRAGFCQENGQAALSNTPVLLCEIEMTAGATQNGGGFVVLNASVAAQKSGAADDPAAEFGALITDGTDFSPFAQSMLDHDNSAAGPVFGHVSNTWVAPIAADETLTFEIRVVFHGTGPIDFATHMSAVYVPFGPDGGNDLTP
jgi:hypothetical protein